MKYVAQSVVIGSIAVLLSGCASKDAGSNDFAKNQLQEMKQSSKHRLSK